MFIVLHFPVYTLSFPIPHSLALNTKIIKLCMLKLFSEIQSLSLELTTEVETTYIEFIRMDAN